jgi:hypothetical protein
VKEEFDDFHIRLEFKWGELTSGPRKGLARDSGILYYCVGPHGAAYGGWMKSVESNVMEEDCGSFWSVAGTIVDVEIGEEMLPYREDPKTGFPVYKKGGRRYMAGLDGGDGIRPSPIIDKPLGEWNVAEVIAIDGTSVHAFNGTPTIPPMPVTSSTGRSSLSGRARSSSSRNGRRSSSGRSRSGPCANSRRSTARPSRRRPPSRRGSPRSSTSRT